MTQTALILGASGRFGRHAAKAFETAGWQVRRFDRKTDDLHSAMAGADVTVNAMNPKSYNLWARALLPLHARVIEAAKGTGTTLIVPGNVYVFGPDVAMPWTAHSPHRAQNPLAQLRIRMEAMYRDAGLPVILLRCGDFIDDQKTMNWFEGFITKPLNKGRIDYPGDAGVPHSWAYLPDAARAMVMLAERRDGLARYEDIPFGGFTMTGVELATALVQATGKTVTAGKYGWWMLQLLRPFAPMVRGLFEMRYLWSLPHRLDGTRMAELLPDFVATPPEVALRQALAYRLGDAMAVKGALPA